MQREQIGAQISHNQFETCESLRDVLDDNDYISIVLETDRPNPELNRAEIKYVPEQM